MAYRVLRTEHMIIFNSWCTRCLFTITTTRYYIYNADDLTEIVSIVCDECVKTVDVVNDYYLEHLGLGCTYTFYDLALATQYSRGGGVKILELAKI